MKLIVESGQSGLNRAGRCASDGRLRGQVCHFSCFGADLAAAASSSLWGGSAAKWQSSPMNSAIPSEGSMQTSWPALRKKRFANCFGCPGTRGDRMQSVTMNPDCNPEAQS